MRLPFFIACLTVCCLSAAGLAPQATYSAESDDFEEEIAPLLVRNCVGCHNARVASGGLDLTSRAAVVAGGDTGPALVPHQPDQSVLLERVRAGEMPPPKKGAPLTARKVELLQQWIASGAVWPERRILSPYELTTDRRAGYDWWSLQPIRPVEVPDATTFPSRHPVDAFVLSRLEQRGLQPSPPADRATLVRRLYFDLIGLPPTPEEVDAFVVDDAPLAYATLVDRLLASRHYGERWARYWLDIAHYADTHGFERDKRRDNAWRYRDYVIDALNSDKPYDLFLHEQVAGDVLYPGDSQALIATGFLAAGPYDFTGQEETPSPLLRKQARADDLDDMVTTVITAAMGLTINCARCHDHKIDPILQEDYYRLWAVFSGVRRNDRPVNPRGKQERVDRESSLRARLAAIGDELAKAEGRAVSLADIVGGGGGFGNGRKGHGINPIDGKPTNGGTGQLANAPLDRFVSAEHQLVDGLFLPGGSAPVTISSTGLVIGDLPLTSGSVWDYVVNGPSRNGTSSKIGDVDYDAQPHSIMGLHANKGITFDLNSIRGVANYQRMELRAVAGYGGASGDFKADLRVYVDGQKCCELIGLSARNQGIEIVADLEPSARFLTFVATDGGDSYAHDQVFLGDARLVGRDPIEPSILQLSAEHLDALRSEQKQLESELASMLPDALVYAAVPQTAEPIHLLDRGNVEKPLQVLAPGALSCIPSLPADLAHADSPEGERRVALARWLTDPANPLTSRVIVNRLWQHHFGTGIVDTPSDFGFYGDRPSHPELLDWLAGELVRNGWSLKHIHRLIVLSDTYRQSSGYDENAAAVDAANRLLWRHSPHRLDAEATRDAVLSVAGNLNVAAGGPGFWEFEYREEYAPVYRYIAPAKPEQFRRSIYRFVVRTSRNPFMEVLDCANPAILTPVRNRTTTPAQSLTLMNNRFMLDQSRVFALRLERQYPDDVSAQIDLGFRLAFCRGATSREAEDSRNLVEGKGLFYLCRVLLNANEFVYVD